MSAAGRSIGICAAVERARWAVWRDVEVNALPAHLPTRGRSGPAALPLLLPPDEAADATTRTRLLDRSTR